MTEARKRHQLFSATCDVLFELTQEQLLASNAMFWAINLHDQVHVIAEPHLRRVEGFHVFVIRDLSIQVSGFVPCFEREGKTASNGLSAGVEYQNPWVMKVRRLTM